MITDTNRHPLNQVYETRDPARADVPIKGVRPHRRGALTVRCQHRFIVSERLDLIANRHYEDPLLFWLVCDAAPDIFPEDLMVPGRVLDIPLNET